MLLVIPPPIQWNLTNPSSAIILDNVTLDIWMFQEVNMDDILSRHTTILDPVI